VCYVQGSYTKRLFDDPDLLQKKLLEEVQELVEATDPGIEKTRPYHQIK
jgi:phosphoribosyl-ATP pyrophosphohydrolase